MAKSIPPPPTRSASPFWRPQPRETMPKKATRDASLVKGAAYSHADILNFDSMFVSHLFFTYSSSINHLTVVIQEPIQQLFET